MKTLIQHISFWGAVVGSLLLALNVPVSGWAYLLLLASNIASIYLSRGTDTPKAIKHQMYFFVVVNIIGVIRWII